MYVEYKNVVNIDYFDCDENELTHKAECYCDKIDNIIVHGFPFRYDFNLLNHKRLDKIIWRMWGHDAMPDLEYFDYQNKISNVKWLLSSKRNRLMKEIKYYYGWK